MRRNTTVDIFAIIDIVLGLLHGLVALFMIGVLVYGVYFSGDTEQEIMEGVIGFFIVTVPLLIGFGVFFFGGLGLMKRKRWGYYLHIAAAVVSFFTIILMIYSILSFIFLFQSDFKRDFFPDDGEEDHVEGERFSNCDI